MFIALFFFSCPAVPDSREIFVGGQWVGIRAVFVEAEDMETAMGRAEELRRDGEEFMNAHEIP